MIQNQTETNEYEIDPNDPIEKRVRAAVRLTEDALKMRRDGLTHDQLQLVEAMEDEGEKLWAEAKEMGKPYVRRENYEDLANAFLQRCVEDYEELLSGAPTEPKKNMELIEDVLEHQQFVRIDMTQQLDHIRNVYFKSFVPYAKKHRLEIVEQWNEFDKKNYDDRDRILLTKHRCPLCGGSFRPRYYRKTYVIGCTNCKLYV